MRQDNECIMKWSMLSMKAGITYNSDREADKCDKIAGIQIRKMNGLCTGIDVCVCSQNQPQTMSLSAECQPVKPTVGLTCTESITSPCHGSHTNN